MNFSFCIRKLAVAFYMINEIQPKIKFQNIVQCPFKIWKENILEIWIVSISKLTKKQEIEKNLKKNQPHSDLVLHVSHYDTMHYAVLFYSSHYRL